MSQFSTSTQNQAQHKAACLSCGLWAMLQEPRICDFCLSDLLGEVQSSAINFGDDVNTAPTSPTVPVGNTGTTSTGHFLTPLLNRLRPFAQRYQVEVILFTFLAGILNLASSGFNLTACFK